MGRRPPPSKLTRERGLANEQRVLDACRLPARPPWMRASRLATRIEDHSGIDIVVDSDVGPLGIQVKSSDYYRKRFRERPLLGIAMVVAGSGDGAEALLEKVGGELEKVREGRLRMREKLGIGAKKKKAPPPPAPPVKKRKAQPAAKQAGKTARPPAERVTADGPPCVAMPNWIELRDVLLAALLRRGPERVVTDAELQAALGTGSLEEVVARYPACFRRGEDGALEAAMGLVELYERRLARCWKDWLRDRASAAAGRDEGARAAMGPFLPVDEEAWAKVLGG